MVEFSPTGWLCRPTDEQGALLQASLGPLRVDDGLSPLSRFFRRAALSPGFRSTGYCAGSGRTGLCRTYPPGATSELDPTCQGVYYDAVTLMTDDGVRLDSWLVPVVDASVVLVQKDDVLRNRHPAVVLVHDFGNRRQQMLPLVRPLHQAGFVVLVIGSGAAGLPAEWDRRLGCTRRWTSRPAWPCSAADRS